MENKHSSGYIQVIFNMMKVCYLFYSSIESQGLYNQILLYIKQIENDDNPLVIENEDDFYRLDDKHWSSIIVNEGLFKVIRNELILNDYFHVQCIHIREESFGNISSLIISRLYELKFLIFEDKSFWSTTSLTLSSIFFLMFI